MTESLSNFQVDALREIISIGIGRAAATLNDMLSKHVRLTIPYIAIVEPDTFDTNLADLRTETLAAVRMGFRGDFTGTASLVFPPDSAAKLVAILTESDPSDGDDMDSLRIGTLSEVGNIIINGVMGSMSNIMSLRLTYTLPTYSEDRMVNLLRRRTTDTPDPMLLARTRFSVDELMIEGVIYLVFESGSFRLLLENIDLLGE